MHSIPIAEEDAPPALADPALDLSADLRGRVVSGRHELAELFCHGELGSVYLGHDQHSGRPVEIKILSPEAASPSAVDRFRERSRRMIGLSHPGLATVLAEGITENGLPYVVMEHREGRNLHHMHGDPRLAWPAPAAVARQLAEALAALHAAGIVHGDVSPGNVVWVEDSSKGPWVQLVDREFRLATPDADAAASLGGQRSQSSSAEPDASADLQALGALLYELCTGHAPDDPGSSLSMRHEDAQIAVPEAFEAVVLALVDADPTARPASAMAVLDLLDRASTAGMDAGDLEFLAALADPAEPAPSSGFQSFARMRDEPPPTAPPAPEPPPRADAMPSEFFGEADDDDLAPPPRRPPPARPAATPPPLPRHQGPREPSRPQSAAPTPPAETPAAPRPPTSPPASATPTEPDLLPALAVAEAARAAEVAGSVAPEPVALTQPEPRPRPARPVAQPPSRRPLIVMLVVGAAVILTVWLLRAGCDRTPATPTPAPVAAPRPAQPTTPTPPVAAPMIPTPPPTAAIDPAPPATTTPTDLTAPTATAAPTLEEPADVPPADAPSATDPAAALPDKLSAGEFRRVMLRTNRSESARTCYRRHARPGEEEVSVVAVVGPAGRIQKLKLDPAIPLADCLRPLVLKLEFPPATNPAQWNFIFKNIGAEEP